MALASALLSLGTARMEASPDPRQVTEADVAQRFAVAPLTRPRVIIDAQQVARLRQRIATEPAVAALVDALVARARLVLTQPQLERHPTGRRLLHVSRAELERQLLLGLAWIHTGEAVFAERAARELATVCAFTDWNPSHFLDVAEMSLAVAIGYDWFHAELPDDIRQQVRAALLEKGLRPSFVTEPPQWWVRGSNNWGQVCHAGMVAAALAIADDEPELARRVVLRAVTGVPCAMAAYAPDGIYPEGPIYWEYGSSFNVILIECLERVLGTDFGLTRQPGFLKSIDFMLQATGPTGRTFNFADCGAAARRMGTLHWFAARQGLQLPSDTAEAGWLHGKLEALPRDRLAGLLPFWLPPANAPAVPRTLDWCGRGNVPVAVHRSSWSSDAWYLACKAGTPSANHGHMDVGAFVLDAAGERWALDLGAEDYERIESRGLNLWSMRPDSDRWRVFRIGSSSHNILTIAGQDQQVAGHAGILVSVAKDPTPFTAIDLTPIYAGQARKVMRTFGLLDRAVAVVSDEIEGLVPGTRVRWRMLTAAIPEAQGNQTAWLRQHGKTLKVERIGSVAEAFVAVPVAGLLAEYDSPAPGLSLLQFEAIAPADGRLAWQVRFSLEPSS